MVLSRTSRNCTRVGSQRWLRTPLPLAVLSAGVDGAHSLHAAKDVILSDSLCF